MCQVHPQKQVISSHFKNDKRKSKLFVANADVITNMKIGSNGCLIEMLFLKLSMKNQYFHFVYSSG